MTWGSSTARSCSDLINRFTSNDPSLIDLIILPLKTLTSPDIQRLAAAIREKRNTHCRTLAASGHALAPADVGALGQALAQGSCALQSLAIGSVDMGDVGVSALIQGLSQTTGNDGSSSKLTTLDLSYKGLTSQSLETILRYCSQTPNLKCLHLSRNPQLFNKPMTMDETINELHVTSITELHLSECNLRDEIVMQLVDILKGKHICDDSNADSTKKRVPLRLHLTSNPCMGAASLQALMQLPLQELYLSRCGMTDADFAHVKFPQLQTLDLSENQLQEGIPHVSEMLQHMPLLRHLDIANNPLGAIGCNHIWITCQTLNSTLDLLDLSQTGCTPELAAHFVHHRSVTRTLRLFNNQLGSSGFEAIRLDGGHPTLEYLDLAGNHASQESIVSLLQSLLLSPKDEKVQNINHDTAGQPSWHSRLHTVVVGGNEGGPALEAIVMRIHQSFPHLDIPRDRHCLPSSVS
jgi:Leucine-rich repeat (LRR) protein